MKCKNIKQLLRKYPDADMPSHLLAEVDLHASACPSCRRIIDNAVEQSKWLDEVFTSSSADCPVEDVAYKVIYRLQTEDAPIRQRSFLPALKPVGAFTFLFLALTICCSLLFQNILSTSPRQTAELRSGKQFAYTVRPETNGRVDVGVSNKRFVRLDTPRTRWAR